MVSFILSQQKLFFWTLEIIVLSLPVLFFVVYVSHLQGQQFAIDEGNIQKRIDEMDKISKSERNLKFWRGYVAMTIARTVFGAGMLYAYFQIYVFKMEMPDRYVCDRVPCQELTTCYIGNFPTSEPLEELQMLIGVLFFKNIRLNQIFRSAKTKNVCHLDYGYNKCCDQSSQFFRFSIGSSSILYSTVILTLIGDFLWETVQTYLMYRPRTTGLVRFDCTDLHNAEFLISAAPRWVIFKNKT